MTDHSSPPVVEPTPVYRKQTVRIPMADGVALAADVYLPLDASTGPWPVALAMTPYGRGSLGGMMAQAMVPREYAVVAVDVRGRYDSPGTFSPVAQERLDAPAVVAWIAGQSWFDPAAGIGTIGLSYLATAGFLAAAASPLVKAVTCITVVVDQTGSFFRNGVLDLHHAFPWSLMTSYSPQPDLRRWDWARVFAHTPVATMDTATGVEVPVWRRLIVDAYDDPALREAMSIRDELSRCGAPVLHLAGWYDFILGESLEAYRILSAAGNAPQALVIGPWTHTTIMTGETRVGDHDFGPESSSRLTARIMAWFDHWLKGKGVADQGVSVFTTGDAGRWLELDGWPDPAAGEMRLHFGEPDEVVTALADVASHGHPAPCTIGRLIPGNASDGWLGYQSNPDDPTPTIGGSVWPFAIAGLTPGPADQRPLLHRQDGLLFIGQELPAPLAAVGPCSVHLVAKIDCPDTDFAIRLIDIDPSGEWRIVQDGIQRARFRSDVGAGHGLDGLLLTPGEQFAVDIDLWATGHRFAAGHRIGVHVAGANFPKYARNLNDGSHPLWADQARLAHHQIKLGASYLTLTVLPPDRDHAGGAGATV